MSEGVTDESHGPSLYLSADQLQLTHTGQTPIIDYTKNTMPAETRANTTSSPPKTTSRTYQKVYHTPDRTRFFDAFHAKPPEQTINAFVKQHKHREWCPSGATLRRWLQQEAESTRTPTRRPPEKPRGRRADNQAALEQVEIMARGPRELRLQNWEYHAEKAGMSVGSMRRYCRRRKPPVLRSERLPAQKIYNKDTAVGYHWIFHEKGYKDGIKRDPSEISGHEGASADVAPREQTQAQAPPQSQPLLFAPSYPPPSMWENVQTGRQSYPGQ
jgi:hypothetical protein